MHGLVALELAGKLVWGLHLRDLVAPMHETLTRAHRPEQ